MESENNALRKLAALLVEFWLRWFDCGSPSQECN